MKKLLVVLFTMLFFNACGLFDNGKLGGADTTETYYAGDPSFEDRMEFLCGVWYSHNAYTGRLDSYRVCKKIDYASIIGPKAGSFFHSIPADLKPYVDTAPYDHDYIYLYDDTVFGQSDDGNGGNGGNGDIVTRYMGVVRAVNIFNGDKERGAVIIEYIESCAPEWLNKYSAAANGKKPFFGIYFRVLGQDIVQMANAVDLAALYADKPYYVEKATLDEAISFNSVENESELISWGVVIPQDREK